MEIGKFRVEHEKIPQIIGEKEAHEISYAAFGQKENENLLICLHGLSRNGRDFDFLAKEMQNSHYVICPDVVGRGKSDWFANSENYAMQNYVAEITLLLEKFGGNRKKIDIVGTSMGGMIAMAMASGGYPFRRMVLNDIGPFIPGEALTRIGKYVGISVEFASFAEAENHLRMILSGFGVKDDAHWRHLTEISYGQEDGKFKLLYDPKIAQTFKMEPGKEMADVEFWEVWEKIDVPILILRGSNSDILLPDVAEKMVNLARNADLVNFPGVGHAPALMANDQIQVIRKYLSDF